MTGQALIVQGDALHLPLPDASVDLIVTSPPYWALRSYSAGPGEIGSEPTPQAFLEALWAATAEMMRVLKPTGSIFVDLGDKYNSAQSNQNFDDPTRMSGRGHGGGTTYNSITVPSAGRGRVAAGIPPKSLLLLPERYRIGCVDRLGLIARAVIVWDKANPLPESAGDRVHSECEDWVHLVKSPRYYSAVDELRQPWTGRPDSAPRSNGATTAGNGQVAWPGGSATGSSGETARRSAPTELPTNCSWDPSLMACSSTICAATGCASGPSTSSSLPCVRTCYAATHTQQPTQQSLIAPPGTPTTNGTPTERRMVAACAGRACERETAAATGNAKLGRWPGNVWRIPSEPLRLPDHLGVQHYAAFPSEWPRRLILGFSPPGICVACGRGRVPVVEKRLSVHRQEFNRTHSARRDLAEPDGNDRGTNGGVPTGHTEATILGYACACTPYTDHPSSGKRDFTEAQGKHNFPWLGGLEGRVGPWREYHLDRWAPPPTRPAIILDPFAGTGTTPMVARVLGRIGIGVDLSMPYCRAARWRVRYDGAKAISRTNLERQGQLL